VEFILLNRFHQSEAGSSLLDGIIGIALLSISATMMLPVLQHSNYWQTNSKNTFLAHRAAQALLTEYSTLGPKQKLPAEGKTDNGCSWYVDQTINTKTTIWPKKYILTAFIQCGKQKVQIKRSGIWQNTAYK